MAQRLEPVNRIYDITEGVQARLKDPLFCLGTQWRTSEFRSFNGGVPVRIETRHRAHQLTELSLGKSPGITTVSMDTDVPLECHVEKEAADGSAPGWNSETLGYDFAISGGGVRLEATDYDGGNLDWYDFRVASNTFTDTTTVATTVRPKVVRYNGMPSDRWYRYEDGRVNLGDVRRPYLNILAMILIEYALIYSRDWTHLAIDQRVGSIRKMDRVRILDSFNVVTDASPLTDTDPLDRGCEMFTLTPLDPAAPVDGSLFYLPNNIWRSLEGPAREEVSWFRDENSGCCWANERLVTVDGAVVDRDEAARSEPAAPAPAPRYWDSVSEEMVEQPGEFPPGEPGGVLQGPLARHVEAQIPPRHRIPYIQQLRNGRVVLSRSRTYVEDAPQFLGALINESHVVTEGEISLQGVTVTRLDQLARDCSGARISWSGRKKRPGTTPYEINLEFDGLVEHR